MTDKHITQEELDAWKALCNRASSEPWEMAKAISYWDGKPDTTEYFVRLPECDYALASDIRDEDDAQSIDNAEFIATSRSAMPRLIAEVEQLHGVVNHWMVKTATARVEIDHLRDAINGALSLGVTTAAMEWLEEALRENPA